MLDIDYIRKNPEEVEKAAYSKGVNIDINRILEFDNKIRSLKKNKQSLEHERNSLSKEEGIKRGRILKEKIRRLNEEIKNLEKEFFCLFSSIPNIPLPDVQIGKCEEENKVISSWGVLKEFSFQPKDHLTLGEQLDIIDVKHAAKVSGSRFCYLKNKGVLLELALVRLAFDVLSEKGFELLIPPVLIKRDITKCLGYWECGEENEYYTVHDPGGESEDLYLVGTAEHSVVPYFKDEILLQEELPHRFAAFSSAFRREAGSYGKDVRGILRVHQFDKVEMVSFTKPEESDKEHEFFLSIEEELFQMLEIPYRVVKMCTGELGFPAARKYDIEAWIPSQNRYREVTSTSTTTDFQARRLNIRYRTEGQEKKYVHILNGTAYAIGRTIIAILENHQQKDGSVVLPKALTKYTGFSKL